MFATFSRLKSLWRCFFHELYIFVCFCFVLFFQETSSSIASSELISDDKMDIERDSRKRKFEKVAVTWP